jgi:hypothetical protein
MRRDLSAPPEGGNASSLSKVQIGLFFFVGFFLLPLSPIWFVVSAFYQLCLVQGTLSSHTRVITAIVCCFFAVAWIPFVNVIVYFQLPSNVQEQVPVRINGLTPLALLVIFYTWGSVIGYRYYTIPSSYEQSRDRASVLKLKKAEINPPLRVALSLAIAARGHQLEGSLDDATMKNPNAAAAALLAGGDVMGYGGVGAYDTAPPPTQRALDPEQQQQSPTAAAHEVSALERRNRGLTFAVLGIANSPRDSTVQQQQQQEDTRRSHYNVLGIAEPGGAGGGNNANANNGGGAVDPAALDEDYCPPDIHLIKNCYDLYSLLHQETGEGFNKTLFVGCALAGLLLGAGRGFEHAYQSNSTSTANYNQEPLYALSTTFAVFFFTQLFATLYFVRLLYKQATHLVYILTYLGRGTTDLRSDRLLVTAEIDSDDEDDSAELIGSEGTQSATHSMRLVSAAAFEEESHIDGSEGPLPGMHYNSMGSGGGSGGNLQAGGAAADGGNGGAVAGYGSASSADVAAQNPIAQALARAKTISSTAAKAAIVELLDPFNASHLSAWNEVRKQAADSIASDYSILNSFLQPTLVLAGPGAVFCLSLYLAIRILFLPDSATGSNPLGIFTIVAASLDFIFLVYLVLIYSAASEARGHFKTHETIIARIAFDVARDLEHAVRRRSQGTLVEGGGGVNEAASVYREKEARLLQNGKVSGIAHEPPRDPVVLQRLFDSVNSLSNHLQTNSPRPLFLGVRTASAKWILVFSLAVTALLLFFGLLRAQRQGSCNVPIQNATSKVGNTTTTGAPHLAALQPSAWLQYLLAPPS